jgi:uncharacterized protein YukE
MTGENIRAQAQAGDWGGHADAKFWHNDFKMVKKIIDDMDVVQVESAARIYEQVSKSVESTMWMLHSETKRLRENWAGEDADAAMQKMQQAYTAAGELYQASKQTSGALAQYAQHQRDWQSQVGGTLASIAGSDIGTVAGMTSPIGGTMNNDHADQLMDKIQQDTVAANSRFPTSMIVAIPDVGEKGGWPGPSTRTDGGGRAPDMPGTPGVGQLPDGRMPGQASGGPVAGHLPSADQSPGGDGGTDLAGYTPPGGGGAGGIGGLGGGLGAGGLGAGGASPGGLGGGLGGGPGAGGVVGGFPGAGTAGAGAAGKPGMGGMGGGMGHGGGGGEEEERERTTWLAEDDNIWGGDDDAAPPVIG